MPNRNVLTGRSWFLRPLLAKRLVCYPSLSLCFSFSVYNRSNLLESVLILVSIFPVPEIDPKLAYPSPVFLRTFLPREKFSTVVEYIDGAQPWFIGLRQLPSLVNNIFSVIEFVRNILKMV